LNRRFSPWLAISVLAFGLASHAQSQLTQIQPLLTPEQAEIARLRAEVNRLTTKVEQLELIAYGTKGDHITPFWDTNKQTWGCPVEGFELVWILVDKWDTTTEEDSEGLQVQHVVNRRKEFDRTCVRK
jgi:hypothetical protein